MNSEIRECLTQISNQLTSLNDYLLKFKNLIDNDMDPKLDNFITSSEFLPLLLEKMDSYLDSDKFSSHINKHLEFVDFESKIETAIDEKLDQIDISDYASDALAETIKTSYSRSQLEELVVEGVTHYLEENEDTIPEILREILYSEKGSRIISEHTSLQIDKVIKSLPEDKIVKIFELIFK